MSKPSGKKPFNLFHWVVLGIVCGTILGVIIGLVMSTIGLYRTDWPNGRPSWEVIKWGFSIMAIVYGKWGAVFGAITGITVWLIRITRD